MGSKREKQRIWPAAGVLVISALLHVALLFLPLPGARHETADPEPSSLRVELVARQSPPETPERTPPSPQPRESEREEPTMPAAPSSMETTDTEEPPSEKPQAQSSSASSSNEIPAAELRPDAIRAQLLGAARDLGRESEQSEEGRGLTYQDVPNLPSRTGWLNQYTGRVEPSVHRWRGNDGSTNARMVTASGVVFCMRRRAPTMEQIFNPSMSGPVTMIRRCGRERPDAPDGTDPWLRRPGVDSE